MNESQEQSVVRNLSWLRKLGNTSTVGVLAFFVLAGWYAAEHNSAFGQLKEKVEAIDARQARSDEEHREAMKEIVKALASINKTMLNSKVDLERRLARIETKLEKD